MKTIFSMNLYNMDRADGTHLNSALQQGVETPCYNINQAYGFWNDHKLIVSENIPLVRDQPSLRLLVDSVGQKRIKYKSLKFDYIL